MPSDADASKPAAPAKRHKRQWAPRLWEGTDVFTWLRMLRDNRFAVEPPYWYIAAIVSVNSVTNTVLRWVLNGWHGERVRETVIDRPPVFVIGHWRTGTTLLHELLIRDTQFGFPDMQDCFNPHHALLTNQFFKRYLGRLLPDKRPMDNMPFGWERPQEDEFALALLGVPSTYTDFAFPRRRRGPRRARPVRPDPGAVGEVEAGVRALPERSDGANRQATGTEVAAAHGARPGAVGAVPGREVRSHRPRPAGRVPVHDEPVEVDGPGHGLQAPVFEGLDEKVLREFRVIYDRLEEARPLFRQGHFTELRYEDLIRDPVGEVGKVYAALNLGDYDAVRPRIEEYQRQNANYETNKYEMTEAQRAAVEERWGDVIRRYGY